MSGSGGERGANEVLPIGGGENPFVGSVGTTLLNASTPYQSQFDPEVPPEVNESSGFAVLGHQAPESIREDISMLDSATSSKVHGKKRFRRLFYSVANLIGRTLFWPTFSLIPFSLSLVGFVGFLASSRYGARQAVLWLIGMCIGVVLVHGGVGFTTAFRNFLIVQKGRGIRALFFMIILCSFFSVCIFKIFPSFDSLLYPYRKMELMIAPPSLSVLLGSFLFGFGMQCADCCSSGLLVDLGNGVFRAFVVLFFFLMGSFFATLPHFAPFWEHGPAISGGVSTLESWPLPLAILFHVGGLMFIFVCTAAVELGIYGDIEEAGLRRLYVKFKRRRDRRERERSGLKTVGGEEVIDDAALRMNPRRGWGMIANPFLRKLGVERDVESHQRAPIADLFSAYDDGMLAESDNEDDGEWVVHGMSPKSPGRARPHLSLYQKDIDGPLSGLGEDGGPDVSLEEYAIVTPIGTIDDDLDVNPSLIEDPSVQGGDPCPSDPQGAVFPRNASRAETILYSVYTTVIASPSRKLSVHKFKGLVKVVLCGPWNLYFAVVCLAVLQCSLMIFAGHYWGVMGIFPTIACWFFSALGTNCRDWEYFEDRWPKPYRDLFQNDIFVQDVSILCGAFLAASLSRSFGSPNRQPWAFGLRSFIAAIVGGLLLGFGSRMAFGCNIGAFFSGLTSFSLHGWIWFVGSVFGNWIAAALRPRLGFHDSF